MVIDTNTLLIVLTVCMAIAVLFGIHTEWRMNKLLQGKSGKTLEEVIVKSADDIDKLKEFRKEIEAYLESVEKRLDQSIRGVSTVRFNPFKGTGEGGHQSFASAFIDAEGNGVVFSTLHTRERMSIFAKPLKNGKSEFELMAEERGAIEKAKERLKF